MALVLGIQEERQAVEMVWRREGRGWGQWWEVWVAVALSYIMIRPFNGNKPCTSNDMMAASTCIFWPCLRGVANIVNHWSTPRR